MRFPFGASRRQPASVRAATAAEQHEARELQETATELGAIPVAELAVGQEVTVVGTLRSITLRPASETMRFEADLYDGSGHITVIWLGRRRISAVNVGRMILVKGRVTENLGRPAIFNPEYELLT